MSEQPATEPSPGEWLTAREQAVEAARLAEENEINAHRIAATQPGKVAP